MPKSLKIGSKFLCLNGKFFDFKKTSLWIFSCNKCILVRLWVKLFVSKGWIQTEITVHTLYFSVNLINFRTLTIPSKTYNKVSIYIYIYISRSAQILQKQNGHNTYAIMKTMCPITKMGLFQLKHSST